MSQNCHVADSGEEVYTEGAEPTLKTTTSSGQPRCEYRLIPHGTHALNKPQSRLSETGPSLVLAKVNHFSLF
jgi:hypothetical protein